MAGLSIYKRNQGQVTRSVTAIALAVIAAASCYYIHQRLTDYVAASKEREMAVSDVDKSYVLVKEYYDGQTMLFPAGTPLTDDVKKKILDLDQTPGTAPKVVVRLSNPFAYALHVQFGVPIVLFAAAAFGIFSLVNNERFADFLIATESEMKKVSWSSRAELIGSTVVVIVTVFILAAFIFGVDNVILTGMKWLGILPSAS